MFWKTWPHFIYSTWIAKNASSFRCSKTVKVSANKNAIGVFAIQTPQHFTYFGWTFAAEFFCGVYHPQDQIPCKYPDCIFIRRRLHRWWLTILYLESGELTYLWAILRRDLVKPSLVSTEDMGADDALISALNREACIAYPYKVIIWYKYSKFIGMVFLVK